MERSIALFLFALAHYDHEFVSVVAKETQRRVVMSRLGIDLGFAFSTLDPGYLDRLSFFARQLTLSRKFFLRSVCFELCPPFFLPIRNDLFGFLGAGVP